LRVAEGKREEWRKKDEPFVNGVRGAKKAQSREIFREI